MNILIFLFFSQVLLLIFQRFLLIHQLFRLLCNPFYSIPYGMGMFNIYPFLYRPNKVE